MPPRLFIKNHIKTMAVAWNGTTLNDKVKLMSVTELAISYSTARSDEGIAYDHLKFTTKWKPSKYWTRSFRINASSLWIFSVTDSISANYSDGGQISASYNLYPVIRLG